MEIPGGTWGEADSGRRHLGQARSSAACRAHQEEAWGDTGVSCLSMSLLAPPQAAILQQTAEYIFSLEQEKTRLLQQNTQLKRFIQVLDGTGRLGQSWLARAGMLLQFLGLRVGPSTLLSQRVEMFPFPWQGREAPFNLASLTWQGEKGWGPVFQYFHPCGVSGMARWQFWCWGALVELPWVSQCENQVGTRLWDENQGGGRRQEPICPQTSNTTPGRPFPAWSCAGEWHHPGRESIHSPLSLTPHSHGRNSVAPPQSGDGQRTKTRGSARRTSGKMRRPRICAGR